MICYDIICYDNHPCCDYFNISQNGCDYYNIGYMQREYGINYTHTFLLSTFFGIDEAFK